MHPSLAGLGDLVVGMLLGALGVLALLLSLLRYKRADPLLAAFGAFVLLYGVRLCFSSELIPALGFSALTAHWVTSTVTYLINVPAWAFFFQLLGRGWHSLVLWWLGVVSAFAVVGIASDVIRQTPGSLARHPNNVLVLLGLVVVALAGLQYRGRMTGEVRILFGGLAVFTVFVVNDNLVSMGLLPWSWREESIGFLIFVACLGVIAARSFFRKERQLATLEGELETAKQIQTSLLPSRLPETDELSVGVRFLPTSAVAGDLYDVLSPGRRRVGFLVADVSGHGVPAALIAAMVKVATSSHRECADRPASLLAKVNQTLCGTLRRGFVSAVYAYVDLERRELLVASAGHPRPLLLRAAAPEAVEVGGQGPILGRFSVAAYADERLPLRPGDRLLLYTDGLLEACSRGGEMLGGDRVRVFMAQQRALGTEEFCDALLAEVWRWTERSGELVLDDDLTLLVVDVPGAGGLPGERGLDQASGGE